VALTVPWTLGYLPRSRSAIHAEAPRSSGPRVVVARSLPWRWPRCSSFIMAASGAAWSIIATLMSMLTGRTLPRNDATRRQARCDHDVGRLQSRPHQLSNMVLTDLDRLPECLVSISAHAAKWLVRGGRSVVLASRAAPRTTSKAVPTRWVIPLAIRLLELHGADASGRSADGGRVATSVVRSSRYSPDPTTLRAAGPLSRLCGADFASARSLRGEKPVKPHGEYRIVSDVLRLPRIPRYEMTRRADEALYLAKRSGRDCAAVWTSSARRSSSTWSTTASGESNAAV